MIELEIIPLEHAFSIDLLYRKNNWIEFGISCVMEFESVSIEFDTAIEQGLHMIHAFAAL